jgi:hypothetical protein
MASLKTQERAAAQDETTADLANDGKVIGVGAFKPTAKAVSPIRMKIWAAELIRTGISDWMLGELTPEKRDRMIVALRDFAAMLERPSDPKRD